MNTKSIDLERSSSQFLYINDNSSLRLTTALTFEVNIKLETVVLQTILSKFDDETSRRNYQFGIDSTGHLFLTLSTDGTTETIRYSTGTLVVDTWYHVAVTYGSSSVKFYIATALDSTQGTIAATATSGAAFRVGAIGQGGGTNYHFDGLIDDIRVWNVVRSATDISNNYQRELGGNESGLVAYYKLNDNYIDSTSNANNLTPSGTPVFSTDIPFTDNTTTSTSTTTTSTSTTTTSTSSSTTTTSTSTSTTTTSTSSSTSSSTSTSTTATETSTSTSTTSTSTSSSTTTSTSSSSSTSTTSTSMTIDLKFSVENI